MQVLNHEIHEDPDFRVFGVFRGLAIRELHLSKQQVFFNHEIHELHEKLPILTFVFSVSFVV